MLNYNSSHVDKNINFNLRNNYLLQVNNHNFHQVNMKRPVGVFWDIENCSIPRGLNAFVLVNRIRGMFHQFNLIEREFVVVCDVYGISQNIINELNNMQVNIIHVCSYAKNASDEKLKQLIYRFAMFHGQYSAIVLLSSDINFAPILSDIKNRIGIFVILFHHQQVSQALISCANYTVDYDKFCSHIPIDNSSNNKIDKDFNMAYLTISSWPQNIDKEHLPAFLNRLISNSGGRVIRIDYKNQDAKVAFKCKSDAKRCLQRVNNRQINGCKLKAKLEAYLPFVYNNRKVKLCNNNAFMTSQNNLNSKTTAQININNRQLIPSQKNFNSYINVLEANRCDICTSKSEIRSQYCNYMFKKKILAVAISIDELSSGLNRLLDNHCGQLPLNALPDCWLIEFNKELDASPEHNHKVMIEHLISCIENIFIEEKHIDMGEEKISVKFLTNQKMEKRNAPKKLKQITKPKLQIIQDRIYSLLLDNMPNKLTTFPSLLLSELNHKYKNKYNENLSHESYGFLSLIELISVLDSKFNLYTYDNNYLIALNFNEQVNCFISDLEKISSHLLIESHVNIEQIPELFKNYFGFELNMAVYGSCYIEDMIKLIEARKLKTQSPDPVDYKILSDSSNNEEDLQTANIESIFKKIVPVFEIFLKSLPNFCSEVEFLYNFFSEQLKSELNINLDHSRFSELVMKHKSTLEIISSVNSKNLISLSYKSRFIELGQRLVKVFEEMCLLGCRQCRKAFCQCNQSICIYQIFFQYLLNYKVKNFNFELFKTKNLVKLYEIVFVYLFKKQIQTQYCLIYTDKKITLQKFTKNWLDEFIICIFAILFQTSTYSENLEVLRKIFRQKYGYSFGWGLIYDPKFQRCFYIFKNTNNENYQIKLKKIYEFASMCLTVMILHDKTLNHDKKCTKSWTLSELENEYYDHFGICMNKPIDYENSDYKSIFKELDWLFELENDIDLQFRLKTTALLNYVDYELISKCNYCEIHIKLQSDTLIDVSSDSKISNMSTPILLIDCDSNESNSSNTFSPLLLL